MSLVSLVTFFLSVGGLVTLIGMLQAPEGYEDQHGFHLVKCRHSEDPLVGADDDSADRDLTTSIT